MRVYPLVDGSRKWLLLGGRILQPELDRRRAEVAVAVLTIVPRNRQLLRGGHGARGRRLVGSGEVGGLSGAQTSRSSHSLALLACSIDLVRVLRARCRGGRGNFIERRRRRRSGREGRE